MKLSRRPLASVFTRPWFQSPAPHTEKYMVHSHSTESFQTGSPFHGMPDEMTQIVCCSVALLMWRLSCIWSSSGWARTHNSDKRFQLGLVVFAYNLSIWVIEAEVLGVQDQPQLHNEVTLGGVKPCLKTQTTTTKPIQTHKNIIYPSI